MLGHRCLHEARCQMLSQKLNRSWNSLETCGQDSCRKSSGDLTMYDARPHKNWTVLILPHRPSNTTSPTLSGPARGQMGFYPITRVQAAK